MSTNDNPALYSISFNLNGGEGDFQRDFSYQMEIIYDIPTREGYAFYGWQRGDTVYHAGDIITLDEPLIILTAIWKELKRISSGISHCLFILLS